MKRAMPLAAAVVILIGLAVAAAGQVSTVPRLGTGTVSVEGDVSVKGDVRVVNEAAVAARQAGPWRVGVEGNVALAPRVMPFVKTGRSYEIRWGGQASEVVVVHEVYETWVRVDSSAPRKGWRWINLVAAQSITEQ